MSGIVHAKRDRVFEACRGGTGTRSFVPALHISTVVLARAGEPYAQKRLATDLLVCAIGMSRGLGAHSSAPSPDAVADILLEGLQGYDPKKGRLEETLRTFLKNRRIPVGTKDSRSLLYKAWTHRYQQVPIADGQDAGAKELHDSLRQQYAQLYTRVFTCIGSRFVKDIVEFPTELIEEAQRGDDHALDALIVQMNRKAVGLKRMISRAGPAADDIAQIAMARVLVSLHQVKQTAGFATYLYRAFFNAYKDSLRRLARMKEVPLDGYKGPNERHQSGEERFPSSEPDPFTRMVQRDRRRHLGSVTDGFAAVVLAAYDESLLQLRRPDARHRAECEAVFRAWLEDQRDQAEMARAMNMDPAKVMRRLDAGIEVFRASLRKAHVLDRLDTLARLRDEFGLQGLPKRHMAPEHDCLVCWLGCEQKAGTLAQEMGVSMRTFKNSIRAQLRVWLGWDETGSKT